MRVREFIGAMVFSLIVGFATAPGMLSASNPVPVKGITRVVETVGVAPAVEIAEAGEFVLAEAPVAVTGVVKGVPEATVAVTEAPEKVSAVELVNYRVSVVSDSIVVKPSYFDIYRTGKLVYAHNTTGLLGNLKELTVGDEFIVTEGEEVRYRVSAMAVYEKTAEGYLNGDPYLMGRIKNRAMDPEGKRHDLALMTCSGIAYGNGDASHRLVVFADAV